MQLPHHAQAIFLIVLPGGGILLVAGGELRHLERGVDVLEALPQHIEGAPKLRGLLFDGGAVLVQLLRQPLDEDRLGVLGVILRKLFPRIGLGVLHPGNCIFGIQRGPAVVAFVIRKALLEG